MVPYPDQLDIPVDPALQSTFGQSNDTPSSSRLNEGEDENADLQVGAADRTISTESQPDGEVPFEPYLLRDTPRKSRTNGSCEDRVELGGVADSVASLSTQASVLHV